MVVDSNYAVDEVTTHQVGSASQRMPENIQQLYWEAKELLRLMSRLQAGILDEEGFKESLNNRVLAIYAVNNEIQNPDQLVPSDGLGQLLNFILDEKVIRGALKQAIDAHGPINLQWSPSAAKRMRAQFKQRANQYRKLSEKKIDN